jgi:hypothetical protein
VLTWTRTCGGGGWLSFGGKTALDALREATRLDPAIAACLVAEETERAVPSTRYGTNGITQGLIIAFAGNALTVPGADSADVAFAMWEEARAVIASRAPRVDDSALASLSDPATLTWLLRLLQENEAGKAIAGQCTAELWALDR